jgi:hypothetical protein
MWTEEAGGARSAVPHKAAQINAKSKPKPKPKHSTNTEANSNTNTESYINPAMGDGVSADTAQTSGDCSTMKPKDTCQPCLSPDIRLKHAKHMANPKERRAGATPQ